MSALTARAPGRVTLLAAALTVLFAAPAPAANHREAPLTALDTKADITDFFAFVNYDDPDRVTLILNVDPLLEPSNGPNYYPFDPEIRYEIKIDNDHDAVEDIGFEFRFNTEIRLPGVFTSFVGAGAGLAAPANAPPDLNGNPSAGSPVVPPAITSLDSAGLSLRQSYTVTRIDYSRLGRAVQRTPLSEVQHDTLYAVPSNVGPRTMPNYADLVDQGIYQLDDNIDVFAGTVDDPFWIALGAAFDSLNFYPEAGGGVLGSTQDGDDENNSAGDDVSGFNVNAIAISVPAQLLTQGDEPVIGTWGTTSRPRVKVYGSQPGRDAYTSRSTTQIQRMANPLVNELLIGTGDKNKFSMSRPKDDAQFASYFLDPLLARVLNAIYGIDIPAPPRLDLLPLVLYPEQIVNGAPAPGAPIADLLRLDTSVPPTAAPSRLGALGGDAAGFPNGRRPFDDVTDIAARVVAGALAGFSYPIGDGVNANDVPYADTFPYLGLAHSGRDSRHVDAGEPGCLGVCPPAAAQ